MSFNIMEIINSIPILNLFVANCVVFFTIYFKFFFVFIDFFLIIVKAFCGFLCIF